MDAADLSATVRDFLSAFVTEVLAVRGLYSPDLFDRRRVLGFVAARRARHPGLAAYIDSAVGSMVVSGTLRRASRARRGGLGDGKREGEKERMRARGGDGIASTRVSSVLFAAQPSCEKRLPSSL
jgi:hypothetical protein